jgi:hypothetical protein
MHRRLAAVDQFKGLTVTPLRLYRGQCAFISFSVIVFITFTGAYKLDFVTFGNFTTGYSLKARGMWLLLGRRVVRILCPVLCFHFN